MFYIISYIIHVIFFILTLYLLKIAIQSSSHNCPIDIKLLLFKLLKLYAIFAFRVKVDANGRIAFLVGDMILPSATVTYGPAVFCISLHIERSSSVI